MMDNLVWINKFYFGIVLSLDTINIYFLLLNIFIMVVLAYAFFYPRLAFFYPIYANF